MYTVIGNMLLVLKRTVSWLSIFVEKKNLLGGGVFGDSLGALTDSVLGKLTRQEQSHGSLDLPRGDGAALVVVGQTACFS